MKDQKALTPSVSRSSLVVVLVVFAFSFPAAGATLRGRLFAVSPNGMQYPVVGVRVTVYSPELGRSVPVWTGQDGMYYMQIPAGSYYLEVWVNPDPRVQPIVFTIQVGEPYTDIPPLRVY